MAAGPGKRRKKPPVQDRRSDTGNRRGATGTGSGAQEDEDAHFDPEDLEFR